MVTLQYIIQLIKQNKEIDNNLFAFITNKEHSLYQLTALFFHIKYQKSPPNLSILHLQHIIENKFLSSIPWLSFDKELDKYSKYPNYYVEILQLLESKQNISIVEWDKIIAKINDGSIDKNFLSLLLCKIYYLGLNDFSAKALMLSILKSGNTYDYRNLKELHGKKVVRRYPTGAVSEKIALLLPAIISAYANQLNIVSPFLIAKSLGFTGGTWDKLSFFDSIIFPTHGDELISVLRETGVAYCMTENDIAPADKFLYQFRSLTGTVEAKSLIISSIGSKQLAIPADFLLMDVRFGDGAFINAENDAIDIGQSLSSLLTSLGCYTHPIYTDTIEPNGSCVGNYWEILESLAILSNNRKSFIYNEHRFETQINLAFTMFIKIIESIHPNVNSKMLLNELYLKLNNGEFLTSFIRVLKHHNVSKNEILALNNKSDYLKHDLNKYNIIAPLSGNLSNIKQKEIGNFVNFYLGNSNYDLLSFTDTYTKYNGIVIKKGLNDKIEQGEVIASIYCTKELETEHLFDSFFEIN